MALIVHSPLPSQAQPAASAPTRPTVPLHRMQPDYPFTYGDPTVEEITAVLTRIHGYLESTTLMRVVNSQTGEEITDFSRLPANTEFERGDMRILSYEWGVTYSGMLRVAEVTGDSRFTDYVDKRLTYIVGLIPPYRALMKKNPQARTPLRSVLDPRSLDDSGSMCAAMIRAHRAGVDADLRPLIDNYIDYITNDQFRFSDGTLARNRPQPNTLWLDDLYMSVPALAQMGKLTGEIRYFDDAVRQVLQFSERMFVDDMGLYMHGWCGEMDVHPAFHWGRANGWAMVAMVELLDVLPEDHPGREAVLDQLKAHIRGIAARQSGFGFWHQLLNRTDSYLETSSTAMFTYCVARAVNRGWIDLLAHAPMALLGWNAVATKVNERGQVEGTCVGTGMAFDPMFYYYRPYTMFAEHGYGPTLLAGAEILTLLKNHPVQINDSSVQFTR
jgi:unsaturated rhamnogalacturonyl hydrolase